ncbi:endonuclease VIII [Thiolapillus sp.]
MPEGPEIRRARDEIAAAVEGRVATRVVFYQPALEQWNGCFDGEKILAVRNRGKAMLTHFANGYSIYSHNQLYGRWLVAGPGETPDGKRQLRLAIHTAGRSALLYSASDIEVWPTGDLHNHPFLKKQGPDVLEQSTVAEDVCRRLLCAGYSRRQLGGFLTDQSFVAGLGNYLRCEILFAAGLHPRQLPCDLSGEQCRLLAEKMLALPRQSYETGGITNDIHRAEKLMRAGHSFEQARFQVFRRAGEPCYRCGSPIIQEKHGGQVCYLCPDCQGFAS